MKKIFLGLLFIFLSQSLQARYYDPDMGRFASRDPLQYIDGMNLYAGYFAQGFFLDPMGTTSEEDCCICEIEPEQCYISVKFLEKFVSHKKRNFNRYDKVKDYPGNLIDIKFYQPAKVELKHYQGKPVDNCHLAQTATITAHNFNNFKNTLQKGDKYVDDQKGNQKITRYDDYFPGMNQQYPEVDYFGWWFNDSPGINAVLIDYALPVRFNIDLHVWLVEEPSIQHYWGVGFTIEKGVNSPIKVTNNNYGEN